MASESDKAEFIQSIKALLIPLFFFLSSLTIALGGFLLYSGYQLGWVLIGIGSTTMVIAFVAMIRFHNQYRALGQFQGDRAMPAAPVQDDQAVEEPTAAAKNDDEPPIQKGAAGG